MQAIDAIEDLLAMLAARTGTAGQIADESGTIRIVLSLPPWEELARSSTDDLIAAAASSPMVLLRPRAILRRLTGAAPGHGQELMAARAAWVEGLLASNFPVISADAS